MNCFTPQPCIPTEQVKVEVTINNSEKFKTPRGELWAFQRGYPVRRRSAGETSTTCSCVEVTDFFLDNLPTGSLRVLDLSILILEGKM